MGGKSIIQHNNKTSLDDNSSLNKEETLQWIRTEFSSTQIGDVRLNKRLPIIIESFYSSPHTSIPHKSGSWSKTKATYRFLNNKKVSTKNILAPHQNATKTRISKQQVVLAIQDTTTLNYTTHPETEGLGSIGNNQILKGMLVHTTLSITPSRVSLGIIHQHTWIRPLEEYGKKHKRHNKSIKDKESQKWINSLLATDQLQKENPNTLFINIGDRESDIYELFLTAKDSNIQSKLLVRATHDRYVENGQLHLWTYMESQPVACKLEVTVPRKKGKAERIAIVEIRFSSVTLQPPKNKSNLSPITLNAIYVIEPSPPCGEEPLSWMLLTTLSISSVEDAILYTEYYALRYTIELFHKILKSGCGIEKHQLKTVDALRRCLALDSIVAWRILFLLMLGRDIPDLPCDVILKEHEWKSLYCFYHNTSKPPNKPPSLSEAIRMIAQIGGFLGRKSDGEPGAKVLWRGMQILSVISASWSAFGP